MPSSETYSDPAQMKEAVEQSSRRAWEYFDAPGTWVLKTNRDFSIKLIDRHSLEEREMRQPEWASVFPNKTTCRNTARICYRGAPFDQKPVVELDEFRATVVQPDRDHNADSDEPGWYWTPYEEHLSHIMSGEHLQGYQQGLDVKVKE